MDNERKGDVGVAVLLVLCVTVAVKSMFDGAITVADKMFKRHDKDVRMMKKEQSRERKERIKEERRAEKEQLKQKRKKFQWWN